MLNSSKIYFPSQLVLAFCLLFFANTWPQSGNGESTENSEFVQGIGLSPLGFVFGTYALSYSLTLNKNTMGLIGGGVKTFGPANLSGYMAGGFYSRNFDLFKNDPSYIGTALVYFPSKGTITLGEDKIKADVDSKVASLSLFYGHSYVWKNGFTMSWRIGAALPLLWDYKWTNPDPSVSDEDFKDETELYENISKVVTTLLGGTGWDIGWSF